MKSFKLTSDGDLSFTDGDKMKPYTIVGKSYQAGIPSPENPIPIVGVTTPFFYDYDGNSSYYKPQRIVLHGIEDELGNFYADTLDVDPTKGICTLTRRVGVDTIIACISYAYYSEKTNSVIARTYPVDRTLSGLNGYCDFSRSEVKFLCTHFPNDKNAIENVWQKSFSIYVEYYPAVQLKAERFTEEELADEGAYSLLVKACTSLLAEWQPQIIFPVRQEEVFEFPYTSNYNHQIEMVEGAELTCQKIKTVLGTNKGEWFFDEEEGINFKNILGKKRLNKQQNTNTLTVTNETSELNNTLKKRLDGKL